MTSSMIDLSHVILKPSLYIQGRYISKGDMLSICRHCLIADDLSYIAEFLDSCLVADDLSQVILKHEVHLHACAIAERRHAHREDNAGESAGSWGALHAVSRCSLIEAQVPADLQIQAVLKMQRAKL